MSMSADAYPGSATIPAATSATRPAAVTRRSCQAASTGGTRDTNTASTPAKMTTGITASNGNSKTKRSSGL